jgi:hypothetical protein
MIRGDRMPTDDCVEKFDNEALINMIDSLSNSRRQLTLSALDYQALGLAKRHEKEKAIDLADELGKVLEILIITLKKETARLTNPLEDTGLP